ncbi:MAG: ABC transporter permease [Cyclobacteriaceae bacterium]
MNQVSLIIEREYISRVKKKSFLIASLLGPLLLGGVMAMVIFFSTRGGDEKTILVLDESNLIAESLQSGGEVIYQFIEEGNLENAKQRLLTEELDGLVYIPDFSIDDPKGFAFYSGSNPSLSTVGSIRSKIDRKVEDLRLEKSGLDREVIESFKVDIHVETYNLNESGDASESSSGAATAIGYIGSLIIYMFIFIYGAMCMRGVIEEKNTRIVEVIVASVRPFQLMMGKVIGIALVGLTQFVIWILVIFGSSTLATKMLMPENAQIPTDGLNGMPPPEVQDNIIQNAMGALSSIDFGMVAFAFLFFFVGGYLLYGALFAAVGSASDSDQDAQQFMLPVTAPLILSIVLISVVLTDPHGTMAFWLSMIPFTSPVTMMVRVPFGVPIWELLLSMVFLVGGFIFTIWVASRVYRVGILMHGTKVNWKILAKWFMTRQ